MVPTYPFLRKETKCKEVAVAFPPQQQYQQPGIEAAMTPKPLSDNPDARGSGKLRGKTAIVTGGDSGIGRAVAYAFAKEGANLVLAYLNEEKDAQDTKKGVEERGARCILVPGDLTRQEQAAKVVQEALRCFSGLDILICNQAVQFVKKSILDITPEQLDLTFRTNVYATFFLIQAALPYLEKGSSIICTTSITAYRGEPSLIDYSSTKGALVSLIRSLSQSLVSQGIRVNGVAPGPVWTPLIPASFSARKVETFGTYTSAVPMGRAGQPFEMAPAYVFLASDDSSYMTGQVLHPNGGAIVSG